MDLNLCISNGTVSTKIYDKRDDFDFDIVNFPFLDGDVPRRTSYGVYIPQLIRFARVSSNLNDFNYRNKTLTAKLLKQGYRYFKLRKAFSKFYRRHRALLEKYSVSLKTLLQQGISEPEFYGDLVYRFRKIVGKSNFPEQFRKLINRYKKIGYKRDDFNFPIVNFPFLSSNIPSAPAYGVYVSQLIRYARTCSNYQDFMERGKVLTQKLLSQGYQKTKLVATLKKFYGRHHDLVNPYNVAVSRIVSDVFASDAP